MCQVRGSIGNPRDSEVPPGVDYELWLGPAPKRPFNKNRFHYNWRFFWDYGNTELGNQGVHMLDVAMWGIQALRGVEHCLPKHVSGSSGIHWLDDAKEVPDTQVMTYDYGDLALVWELRSFGDSMPLEGTTAGTAFYGTDAALIVDGSGCKVLSKKGEPGPSEKPAGGSHTKNFLDCLKSRQRPSADIELGRLSTTICHLGNICTRLKRDVHFDPKAENFGSDKDANALLTKDYRQVALMVLHCPVRCSGTAAAPFVTSPLSVILAPQGVVTIVPRPVEFLEPMLNGTMPGVSPTLATEFVLRIFWQLADAYLDAVRENNASVERLEDQLKRSLRNEEVLGLLDYQKSLTYFATAMGANELVLERLQRTPALRLGEHDQELLDDVRVEVRQAIEMVDISDNILSQMMDAFASIVSNNLNSVMKVLTSVTILLAIPTLIASLYGMNVLLPGARSTLAFAGIMLLCAVLCAALFVVFRRRNWL